MRERLGRVTTEGQARPLFARVCLAPCVSSASGFAGPIWLSDAVDHAIPVPVLGQTKMAVETEISSHARLLTAPVATELPTRDGTAPDMRTAPPAARAGEARRTADARLSTGRLQAASAGPVASSCGTPCCPNRGRIPVPAAHSVAEPCVDGVVTPARTSHKRSIAMRNMLAPVAAVILALSAGAASASQWVGTIQDIDEVSRNRRAQRVRPRARGGLRGERHEYRRRHHR